MQVESIAGGAFCNTSDHLSLTFILSIFEWLLKTGFTVPDPVILTIIVFLASFEGKLLCLIKTLKKKNVLQTIDI